jgi:rhodanese-related sulfurtransferase
MIQKVLLGLLASLVLSGFFAANLRAEEVPRMTQEELKEILGKPGVVVIDVRANADWTDSKQKIKGAVREDPKKVASWIGKYPTDRTLVFYCS